MDKHNTPVNSLSYHEVELQISCGICSKISQESILRGKAGRDTVGKNTKAIKEYIAGQLKRDREMDQISMYDMRDPFKGSK